MLRLKNQKTLPKDGFIYVDPSGRTFGGMYSFSYVVQQIVAYRVGNDLPRQTKAEASEDLDLYTCMRDPSLCYDSSILVSASVRSVTGCRGCGIVTT